MSKNLRFTSHMEEVMARQLELQKQIRQENREMRDMKANATSRSLHVTTGRAIPNAKLLEHFKWGQTTEGVLDGFMT